jgi:hypothetical protein
MLLYLLENYSKSCIENCRCFVIAMGEFLLLWCATMCTNGDNLNKVRSCANIFSRCAGYSTNSLQNILLNFAWSTSMSSGDGDWRIMAFSSGCKVVGHYHKYCCWRSLNMCVTFVIVQTAPEPSLFSI